MVFVIYVAFILLPATITCPVELASEEATYWAMGFRNPQGIAGDEETGEIFVTDHGDVGNDELNRLVKGGNYGWPTERAASKGTIIQDPLISWTPSIAPGGLSIYSGERAYEKWKGDLLIGSLSQKRLIKVHRGENALTQESYLDELGLRIRLARSTPEGRVAVITDSVNGKLLEFSPSDLSHSPRGSRAIQ